MEAQSKTKTAGIKGYSFVRYAKETMELGIIERNNYVCYPNIKNNVKDFYGKSKYPVF
jgi:hypothetical protein